MASRRGTAHSWEHSFFKDHPNWDRALSAGDLSGVYNPEVKDKHSWQLKVFCVECLNAEINIVAKMDMQKVESGHMETCRTREQIEADIWLRPVGIGNTRGSSCHAILCAATSTLINHLKSSQAPSHVVGMSHSSSSIIQPALSNEQHFPHQSHVISLNSPLMTSTSLADGGAEHIPADDAISSISSGSLAPSDSLSRVVLHAQAHCQQNLQSRYEELLICITASTGLPLSWVDNLEFDAFVAQFIPQAKPVS
ncbi:hypothetical protein GYMLUDRAFT_64074 [Collybiopsis luxurians FD-317 M1]|uniref:Uncharacterized protein n=1 Tax=Collybiopsis luxurians FD-317 M1 TaxID=944289 RepID=A0A0D0C4D8_9AGAR|nr:hypothetical protein GYMLUDRAFT_64074 [Collybiopsis luxurians FD-317 M1]